MPKHEKDSAQMRVLVLTIAISMAITGASNRHAVLPIHIATQKCGGLPTATVLRWDTLALSSAPLTLRLPREAHSQEELAIFQDDWLTKDWELRVDVSSDSTGAPFASVGGPQPASRSDSIACNETVAGRKMRIVTYRQPSGELRGQYAVVADWPLATGAWLRIGGVASNTGGQHLLEEVVQTLALTDSVTASKLYHPTSRCEASDRYYESWSSRQLRYAPARLLVPRDMQSKFSTLGPEEVLGWSKGGASMVIMYRVLHTTGWQLKRPDHSGGAWCQMQVAGHLMELTADSVMPQFHYPIMKVKAYCELSPGVVLAIESHLRGDFPDGLNQLLAVLASIRQTHR